MSAILDVTALRTLNSDVLDSSHPYFNGIRVLEPELLLSIPKPPYYGDEVTIGFYRALGLLVGTNTSPSITYTPGWTYKYNHTTRVFIVYDENNRVQSSVSNVTSLGDMGISMEIYKSHAFEIIMEANAAAFRFIFPTDLIPKIMYSYNEDLIEGGVQNMDTPYAKYLPSNIIKYFMNPFGDDNEYPFGNSFRLGYQIGDAYKLIYTWLLSKSNIVFDGIFDNGVYIGGFDEFAVERIPKELFAEGLDLKFLLSLLLLTFYPDINPIEQGGETQNNRPIYEPWIIWMILYKYNEYVVDNKEDIALSTFDLSPVWS